jgi:hypothetical protein
VIGQILGFLNNFFGFWLFFQPVASPYVLFSTPSFESVEKQVGN